MDRILELFGRLTTLTNEELTELRGLIVEEGQRLDSDESTIEEIATLQELAGYGEQVMAESAERDAKAQQAQADRQAARERINALNPAAEGDEEEEPEEPETPDPAPEEPEEPAAQEPAGAPEGEPVPEPVVAGGQVARMAARQPRPVRSPEAPSPERRRAVLTAAGALRGRLDPSKPIENRDELATAMAETLNRMSKRSAPMGDQLLASATWELPPERQLGTDAWENARKIDAVTGAEALTASGGICAPTNVDYSLDTWATADRPLRDALPSFQATRGGLLFVAPPQGSSLAAATSIWTEATDASPGAATKPVISIQCGNTVQVFVDAIPTRLGFGNMQARFAPEQVAANTDLAMAFAARVAENNLLNKIAAQCVADVTSATLLGATRDLMTVIDQVVAGYRSVNRIPRSQAISAIFPDWIHDVIRTDLAREAAHQQDSSWNSLAVTDQMIDDMIKAHGVNPIFHLDGQPSSVAGGVAQVFGTQAGTGAVNPYPTKLVWYVYAEGMFQFLDGGRLDLGVVRDSTLDATNDYETFVEPFEGIAYRGFSGGAYQMVSTLCANGGSASTISTAGSCA
ncbi:MAG TPA: major capsid protein [Solirubrobacteraceae bacterium]|jgi:hypothetical protein|nr:major capsid protein [Solirubrobacteraceae bacterium]